jgi:hypothetical protein
LYHLIKLWDEICRSAPGAESDKHPEMVVKCPDGYLDDEDALRSGGSNAAGVFRAERMIIFEETVHIKKSEPE